MEKQVFWSFTNDRFQFSRKLKLYFLDRNKFSIICYSNKFWEWAYKFLHLTFYERMQFIKQSSDTSLVQTAEEIGQKDKTKTLHSPREGYKGQGWYIQSLQSFQQEKRL